MSFVTVLLELFDLLRKWHIKRPRSITFEFDEPADERMFHRALAGISYLHIARGTPYISGVRLETRTYFPKPPNPDFAFIKGDYS